MSSSGLRGEGRLLPLTRAIPPARRLFRRWRLTDSDWGGARPSQSDPEETFSRHRGQRPVGHISLVLRIIQ